MSDDYFTMTQAELAEYARVYGDNDDGRVPLAEIEWTYVEGFDVSRLLSIKSVEEWREWFDEEIDISIVELESPDRWAPMLDEDIVEPVVIVEYPDGELLIWDGWHRSAASVLKGAETLKVVFGVAPGLVPTP